jgi:putative heme-binding domain-containing protein
MTEGERFVLGEIAAGASPALVNESTPAPFVYDWSSDELLALASLRKPSKDAQEAGLAAFAKARCLDCHRFENTGGAKGPDLTGARRRFSAADLVETIIAPSSTISDQYSDEVFELADDELIIGRLLIDSEGVYVIEAVAPEEAVIELMAEEVISRNPHSISRMPEDLLDVLTEEEVQSLFNLLLGPSD